jgi:TetR/AcrR family transcriptional regulator, repressor for neighboring sulfatase
MSPARPHTRSTNASPARKRLTADEARTRILAAAERRLSEVGPEGLRLTDLAAELGVSHPAILHHFGSREELVVAVVSRAMARLNERLIEATKRDASGHETIMHMVADFYASEGHARVIAWLVLSGRALKWRLPKGELGPLEQLIRLSHAQRIAEHPERTIDYEDTRFRGQLTALALLGDAIFGNLIRYVSGDELSPARARDFRKRLAGLIADEK